MAWFGWIAPAGWKPFMSRPTVPARRRPSHRRSPREHQRDRPSSMLIDVPQVLAAHRLLAARQATPLSRRRYSGCRRSWWARRPRRPGGALRVRRWLRLPADRPLCLFPPRQRPQSPAFLCPVPGLVRRSSASITPATLDGFDKVIYFATWPPACSRRRFPALLPDFPGARAVVPNAVPRGAAVPARAAVLRRFMLAFSTGMPSEPASRCRSICAGCSTGPGLCCATIRFTCRRLCAERRVPQGRRSHRPAAAQVAAQRRLRRHPAVRRCSTSCRTRWA